jgi:hypothetical protein
LPFGHSKLEGLSNSDLGQRKGKQRKSKKERERGKEREKGKER